MHAAALRVQGYAVLRDLLAPNEVRVVRQAVIRRVERVRPPALYSRSAIDLGDGNGVTPTGFAIGQLLERSPELEPVVLPSALREVMAATLGDDHAIELVGAVISDRRRPFFSWHTHIDREDESQRVRAGRWPAVDRVLRVLALLYLDDLNDDSGPLYVLPRQVGDPTEPPHPLDQQRWPGMVELRPRAGTVVALEQCTWHAAKSMRGPGTRVFVGSYFSRAGTHE